MSECYFFQPYIGQSPLPLYYTHLNKQTNKQFFVYSYSLQCCCGMLARVIIKSVGFFTFMQNDQVTSANFLHFKICWESCICFQF